ncbi:MAG: MFS transporter [Candidatus Zixiibacteriota bacterium]
MSHSTTVKDPRILLFSAGAMAGCINVTLPASATVFLDPKIFNFSNSMYGGLFVFFLSTAVLASWFFRLLAARFTAGRVLQLGMMFYALGALLFAGGLVVADQRMLAYAITCLSVLLLGFGFGGTLSALNELIVAHSSRRPEISLTYLHAVVTGGAALAPAIVGFCIDKQCWAFAPIGEGIIMLILLFPAEKLFTAVTPSAPSEKIANERFVNGHSRAEIFFLLLAGLYGLCESAVANWSTVILQSQYAMVESHATVVMSLFWGSVATFRFLFARFTIEKHVRLFWFLSPIVMLVALVVIGISKNAILVVSAVTLGGCAMSYYFPLTLAIAGSALPKSRNRLSGTTVATLLSGAGISAISIGLISDLHIAEMSTIVGGFGLFAFAMIVIQARMDRIS